jgi:hypothetical protein
MIKNKAKRLITSHIVPLHIALHIVVNSVNEIVWIKRSWHEIFARFRLLWSASATPSEHGDHGRCTCYFPSDREDAICIHFTIPELAICRTSCCSKGASR